MVFLRLWLDAAASVEAVAAAADVFDLVAAAAAAAPAAACRLEETSHTRVGFFGTGGCVLLQVLSQYTIFAHHRLLFSWFYTCRRSASLLGVEIHINFA